jgi:hypothetical protein
MNLAWEGVVVSGIERALIRSQSAERSGSIAGTAQETAQPKRIFRPGSFSFDESTHRT